MRIVIVGRKEYTANYERYLSNIEDAQVLTTLSLQELKHCNGVILPGGGDITPAFFGERNYGSRTIDTELDILQLEAFDYCVRHKLPVLGICKGMQIINVALGGTIIQDLPTAWLHQYQDGDQYHITITAPGSILNTLYGKKLIVNSAHHQGIRQVGRGLVPIQWCPLDGCIEAIMHENLPILGLQWHPERIDEARAGISNRPLLHFFLRWVAENNYKG